MSEISIRVDGREIRAKKGVSLLAACLEAGIYIPNLCHIEGMAEPPASCRLCFVEIDGRPEPATSCTVSVESNLVVRTDTPDVRRLQRTGLRLLLSVHDVDCKNCVANKRCELQRMAKFLGVGLKPKDLDHYHKEPEVDDTHPRLIHRPNRCVLCGRCIHVCQTLHGRAFIAMARRGFDTILTFYGSRSVDDLPGPPCSACVDVCPVGALESKAGGCASDQTRSTEN